MNPTAVLARLRRIRWGVRLTLTFGVLASVAANVLHAQQNLISQVISAWPPLALLLTAELVSRVPVHRKLLAVTRVGATVVIAGIAAWVSYWHMAAVAARYGETDATPYLLPISVDGLIVVASISLVELAARIRQLEEAAPPTPAPVRAAASAVVVSTVDGQPLDAEGADTDAPDEALDDRLIASAYGAADQHRRQTGTDITRDQLRAALRVSNRTAGRLLHIVRTNPNNGPAELPAGGVRVMVPTGPVIR